MGEDNEMEKTKSVSSGHTKEKKVFEDKERKLDFCDEAITKRRD